MINSLKTIITVRTLVNATVEKVWTFWSDPKHIVQWSTASDDWHTTRSENDLRVGGRFISRMEAKDGSFGFDFSGRYDQVDLYRQINYTLNDDRKVEISFIPEGNTTLITESFEAENENSVELQKAGWQAILENFRKHVEGLGKKQEVMM
jgi:uncharacterized protein YndB with AHSA1/START domain